MSPYNNIIYENSIIFKSFLQKNSYSIKENKGKIKRHPKVPLKNKNKKHLLLQMLREAPPRFELGIRVLQTHALPLGYSAVFGADYEARTRYLHLDKVALYQMS